MEIFKELYENNILTWLEKPWVLKDKHVLTEKLKLYDICRGNYNEKNIKNKSRLLEKHGDCIQDIISKYFQDSEYKELTYKINNLNINNSNEKLSFPKKNEKVKNKGTGAGGSKTNENGFLYEELTELNDSYLVLENLQYAKKIKFIKYKKIFIKTKKYKLFKHMQNKINNKILPAHGCKNPDECYIDEKLKNIFIIEKKFQQTSGSVCEKIQTSQFKLWQYSRTFPDYNIIYIYCLSDWFKKNCKAELEYLDFIKCPYFLGNSKTYKDDIINFIINYK